MKRRVGKGDRREHGWMLEETLASLGRVQP
jgi:hypothetical protein